MGGGTKSGSPLETRDATQSAADSIQGAFSDKTQVTKNIFGMPITRDVNTPISFEEMIGRLAEASGRLTSDAGQNILGLDTGTLDTNTAAQTALNAPRFDLSAMFQALQPFEDRETALTVGGVRNQFGSAGGRFSRNLSEAEGFTRGALADQHARRREELAKSSFEDSEARRIQALNTILPQLNNASQIQGAQGQQLLATLLQFLQPGGSVEDPGFIPGLLQAGATVAGAALI